MKLVQLLLISALAMLWAGAAAAAEVNFRLVASETFDASFPSTMTYSPAIPVKGTGDIDEDAGTYSVSLPDFTVELDIFSDSAIDNEITTTNWGQTGTFAGGLGGTMTGTGSTGTRACIVVGGVGSAVCPDITPTVEAWPPPGDTGPTLGAPSASIDIDTNTITVVYGYDLSSGGGQVRNTFTYEVPPDVPAVGPLGAALLACLIAGAGLMLGRKSS